MDQNNKNSPNRAVPQSPNRRGVYLRQPQADAKKAEAKQTASTGNAPREAAGNSQTRSSAPVQKGNTRVPQSPARNVGNAGNTVQRRPASSGTNRQTNGRPQRSVTQSTQSRSYELSSAYERAPENVSFNVTLNKKSVAVIAAAVLVIVNIVLFCSLIQHKIPEKQTPEEVAEESRLDLAERIEEESGFTSIDVPSSDYTNGTLVLVNSEHPFVFDNNGSVVRDDEIVRVGGLVENRSFKVSDNTIFLCTETISALNKMMKAFNAYSGKNDVMILEAFRSREDQQSIYDSKVASLGADQKIAALPGESEHHTGYAMDISIYPDGGVGARSFTGDGVYGWIYEHGGDYGFVLRYPEGKTGITGIDPESWHFRYVGVPHSVYMNRCGITLEEYVSDLAAYTENVPLIVDVSDTESYAVYSVKKSDSGTTKLPVPKDKSYGVSGNNVDGFIVWYKVTEDAENEASGTSASGDEGSTPTEGTNSTDASAASLPEAPEALPSGDENTVSGTPVSSGNTQGTTAVGNPSVGTALPEITSTASPFSR